MQLNLCHLVSVFLMSKLICCTRQETRNVKLIMRVNIREFVTRVIHPKYTCYSNSMVMLYYELVFVWVGNHKLYLYDAFSMRPGDLHMKPNLQNAQLSNNNCIVSTTFWCLFDNQYLKFDFRCKIPDSTA